MASVDIQKWLGNRVTTREIGDIPGCIPAPHDETLMEEFRVPDESYADAYCAAIQSYLSDGIDERTMFSRLKGPRRVHVKQKRTLPPWHREYDKQIHTWIDGQ